jgi:hypothetical protein
VLEHQLEMARGVRQELLTTEEMEKAADEEESTAILDKIRSAMEARKPENDKLGRWMIDNWSAFRSSLSITLPDWSELAAIFANKGLMEMPDATRALTTFRRVQALRLSIDPDADV